MAKEREGGERERGEEKKGLDKGMSVVQKKKTKNKYKVKKNKTTNMQQIRQNTKQIEYVHDIDEIIQGKKKEKMSQDTIILGVCVDYILETLSGGGGDRSNKPHQ
jgi:uncharacterized protein YeeX (DUF496 family)